jgi:hypothetical protein
VKRPTRFIKHNAIVAKLPEFAASALTTPGVQSELGGHDIKRLDLGLSRMARELLVFVLGATVTVLLGDGLYASFRQGELKTVRARRSVRRSHQPLQYWLGMAAVAFAFVVMASITALFAFLLLQR